MLFCQGFSSFFETLPHRFVRNRFDNVEFDGPLCQQSQRPTRMSRRLGTATQRDDFRLFLPIQNLGPREPCLRLAIQGGFPTFQHQPLANILHRANRHATSFRNRFVRPPRPVSPHIRQQQHLRMRPFFRSDFVLLHQLRQFSPFVLIEFDHIAFRHCFPSMDRNSCRHWRPSRPIHEPQKTTLTLH